MSHVHAPHDSWLAWLLCWALGHRWEHWDYKSHHARWCVFCERHERRINGRWVRG